MSDTFSDTSLSTSGFDGGDAAFVAPTPTGPVCEKCEAPLPDEAMTACPSCGWYASLNTYVEIAQDWEAACNGQSTGQAPKTVMQVWATLVPLWGWLLLGTTLTVAGASFAASIYLAEDAAALTTWSVVQLLVGAAVVVTCHLLAFFMAASTDPDMGVLDLVVSPLKGWVRVFRSLPKRFWVLNTANIGLTAALSTFAFGALPYEEIWNWGFKEPAKQNLLGAIADKAGGGGGDDMNMEDAMGSFAQNAALSGDFGGVMKKGDAAGKTKRQKIDALIVGYQLAHDGRIDTFFLATEQNGRLYYAGRVRPKLTEEEEKELPLKLKSAKAPRPFVNVPGSALWLQAKFTCRVTYDKRVESGMLRGMIWEEMLGEIKQSW